jgi:hypothetical protein
MDFMSGYGSDSDHSDDGNGKSNVSAPPPAKMAKLSAPTHHPAQPTVPTNVSSSSPSSSSSSSSTVTGGKTKKLNINFLPREIQNALRGGNVSDSDADDDDEDDAKPIKRNPVTQPRQASAKPSSNNAVDASESVLPKSGLMKLLPKPLQSLDSDQVATIGTGSSEAFVI